MKTLADYSKEWGRGVYVQVRDTKNRFGNHVPVDGYRNTGPNSIFENEGDCNKPVGQAKFDPKRSFQTSCPGEIASNVKSAILPFRPHLEKHQSCWAYGFRKFVKVCRPCEACQELNRGERDCEHDPVTAALERELGELLASGMTEWDDFDLTQNFRLKRSVGYDKYDPNMAQGDALTEELMTKGVLVEKGNIVFSG